MSSENEGAQRILNLKGNELDPNHLMHGLIPLTWEPHHTSLDTGHTFLPPNGKRHLTVSLQGQSVAT